MTGRFILAGEYWEQQQGDHQGRNREMALSNIPVLSYQATDKVIEKDNG